jgi:hypothetical protein
MMSQPVSFPLQIDYPAHLPYAAIGPVERVGDKIRITYQDAQELKACLELHREAHRLQADVTSEYAKSRLTVSTKELI